MKPRKTLLTCVRTYRAVPRYGYSLVNGSYIAFEIESQSSVSLFIYARSSYAILSFVGHLYANWKNVQQCRVPSVCAHNVRIMRRWVLAATNSRKIGWFSKMKRGSATDNLFTKSNQSERFSGRLIGRKCCQNLKNRPPSIKLANWSALVG